MPETRRQGIVVGVLMLAAGLAYLSMTADLPRRATVDAAFVPYILGFAMVGLGALQVVTSLRPLRVAAAAAVTSDEGSGPGRPSYATVLKTLALMAAFTAALTPLGFPVAAAIYLFLQFLVLRPVDRNFGYPVYAAVAVVTSVVVFVTFRYGFDLLLPGGPLTPYIP
jgi:putative tricarboxylic transport membrane protein